MVVVVVVVVVVAVAVAAGGWRRRRDGGCGGEDAAQRLSTRHQFFAVVQAAHLIYIGLSFKANSLSFLTVKNALVSRSRGH
jgi:hypothetical protein